MQNRSFVGENTLKAQGAYIQMYVLLHMEIEKSPLSRFDAGISLSHRTQMDMQSCDTHKRCCIRSVYCTCTHYLCMHTPVQEGLKTFPFQSVSLSFHSLPKSCSFTVGIGSIPLRSVQNRCRTCVRMRAVISERHCEHISSITCVGTAFPLLHVYAKKKTLFHSPARESLPRLRSACHAEFTTERKLNGKGTANGTKLCV